MRIAAAQTKYSFVAGYQLSLRGRYTSDLVRAADGYCDVMPNFLAWCLSQLGIFTFEDQDVVPVLPSNDPLTAGQAIACDFQAVQNYVTAHRIGNEGADIPEADVPVIARLRHVLPSLNLNNLNRRFNAAAFDFWRDPISPHEWTIFTSINAALREQKMTVEGCRVSAGIGSPLPVIRFPLYELSSTEVSYYSLETVSTTLVRAALVLRPGMDEYLEDAIGTRFIGDHRTALISGHDTPALFQQAQLNMMSKVEL